MINKVKINIVISLKQGYSVGSQKKSSYDKGEKTWLLNVHVKIVYVGGHVNQS